MQALSCGSPSAVATPVAAPRGSTALPEVEKSEVAKPSTDRLLNMIRLSASKPDLGTPRRVPMDSNGQRLCSTPKIERAAGRVRNHVSQTPKSVRPLSGMRNHVSPTPKKVQVVSGIENIAPNSQEDSEGAHDLPLDTFTIYANPSFEPLETVESPIKEQKQASCIPVDSNGQKLCPTPKRTPSLSSPGVCKLRFPKATSFQPLETIQSPTTLKDQAKGVLVDSNGQRTQGTPKLSKQFTTPKERTAAFGTKCAENLTPRALFNDSHGAPAPRSISRVSHRAAKPSGVSELGGAKCSSSAAKEAVGSKMKKRGRGEGDAAVEDENTRVTRSRTEAERIALFLRSPAARVRPDGRKEEYWHGISDVLVEKYMETKLMSASKIMLTQ